MPSCHHAVKDFVVVKTRPKRRFATRHGQQPSSPELLMARRSVSFLLYFVFSSPKRRVYNNYRENNLICLLFPKRKRQLYKMSAKTGGFRIQMRITGQENTKTYIPLFTLVDFESIVETEAKQRQIETFLLIVVNLFGSFWKIFLTLYCKNEGWVSIRKRLQSCKNLPNQTTRPA